MDATQNHDAVPVKHATTVERPSDCEIVVQRTFNAPARIVFEAWTTPALLMRWWAPKSMGLSLVGCEIDLRTGGGYRFQISHPEAPQPLAFFGRYLEVDPPSKIVWTNEESPDGAITTVTFKEKRGTTLVTMSERYASREALAANAGMENAAAEMFAQLDALLAG